MRLKIKKDTKFKRDYPLIVDPPVLYVGRGVNLRSPKLKDRKYREEGALIYLQNRTSHLITFGRTRWGKTRFIERAVVDDIEVGNSVFIIDPKGDYELLEAVIDAVERTGRQEDFMFFSVVSPEVSIKLNPFSGMLPDRIGDMLKSLAPAGKEGEFFASVAFKLGKAVALGLYALGQKEIKIVDILQRLDLNEIRKLYDEVTERGLPEFKQDAQLSLKPLTEKDEAFWSKISSTAEVLLDQLSTGIIGELFGKVEGNPIRERLLVERKKLIFYGFLARLVVGEEIASSIAKLLSTTLIGIYGHMYANNDSFDHLFVEYIDEAKQVFHVGIEQKFNIAGGLNVSICAFTQSKGDLEEKLGKALTKVILDNTNWLIFSVLDSETAQEFSKASGTKKTYEPVWEEGDGRLPKLSLVPKDRPLIESSEFMRMDKGCFHAFLDGSWYRGYSDLLKDRRKIWIKPLKYPVKELIERLNVDRESALSLREDEETVKKLVDLVVDLRTYPYYEKYVKQGKKTKEEETPKEHREEIREKEVSVREIPSPMEAERLINEVDRFFVRKIIAEYDKLKDIMNRVGKSGVFEYLKQGRYLYVSELVAKKGYLSRDVTLSKKRFHTIRYKYRKENRGKEFIVEMTAKALIVDHEGILDFIPDYEFPIEIVKPQAIASSNVYV